MQSKIRLLERLRATAQSGLTYTKDVFDIQRYTEQLEIIEELTHELTNIPLESIHKMTTNELGYRTPKVDVRGALFKDNKVLLCKERSDGKWTLPGGWADVGLSASENVIKEIKEETGLEAKALKLISVLDRDKHPHTIHLYHIYKMFFLCEVTGGELTPNVEISDLGYFDIDNLPELSIERVTKEQIIICYNHYLNPSLNTLWD